MATLTASRAPGRHYLAAIERARHDRAHEPAWLREVRRAAADAFERAGIPTTKQEDWRFTNVAPIADTPYVPAPVAHVSPEEAGRFLVPGLAGPVLVFVNGRYTPELSDPGVRTAGITVSTLADALEGDSKALEPCLGRHTNVTDRPFVALNTAVFDDGALITLADNAVADLPIQVVFLSTVTPAPAMTAPRVLVVLGSNSQAKLIETFGGIGPARGFTNAVTEIVLGDGSVLDHYRLQRESEVGVSHRLHRFPPRPIEPFLVARRHVRRSDHAARRRGGARRRGRRLHPERPLPRRWTPVGRQSHRNRPRQAARQQP